VHSFTVAKPSIPAPRAGPTAAVLRWDDEQQVAALLARAFVDDPLVIRICEAPAPQRQERMRWSFRVAVRSHWLGRQPAWTVVDAGGTPLGVVLAARSRLAVHPHSDLLFTLRSLCHIGVGVALRGLQAAQIIASQVPRQPFTYLRTLGVAPEHQRHGLGSRLVEQVLRAAPPALPVYLETAKEQNVPFYTRHGFAPAGEFECLGVPVWRLLRPATADGVGVPRQPEFSHHGGTKNDETIRLNKRAIADSISLSAAECLQPTKRFFVSFVPSW
jgi:GNAT superfamily N-acetyltransferase